MAEITYEVYVLEGGRWTIESRYSNLEREVAIEDAKSMHTNPKVKAVKVIKETYDAVTNSTVEAVVFTTESISDLSNRGSNFADMEVDVGGDDFADMEFDLDNLPDFDDPLPSRKPKKKKPTRPSKRSPIGAIFIKIMLITAVSLGIAFLMTYLSTEGYFG